MVVASITLLPAFLGLAGHRINGRRLRRRRATAPAAPTDAVQRAASGWQRWGATSPAMRRLRDRRHRAAAGAGRAGARAAPGLPRRGHAAREPDRTAGLRPRRRRASVPASTARWSSPSTSRGDPSVVEPLRAAIAADRGIAAVAPADDRRRAGVATLRRVPDHRRRRTRPRSRPSSACGPTCSRRRSTGSPASAHVGGATATWGDLGDGSRTGCRCSSPRSSCCRSCC